MNRFIFDTLTFLNGLLAVMLIVIGTAIGWAYPSVGAYSVATSSPTGMQVAGAILGGLCGLAVAAIICGTIAFFALIEKHLRVIAERGNGRPSFYPTGSDARSEPKA